MRTCIRRENKDKYKPDTNDHLKAIREKTEKQRKEEKPLEIYIHQKKIPATYSILHFKFYLCS
ncbi:hypothetical protein M107_3174 [Bacteroides fragilis str. 3725 D9(v)]|jgi:hypothetical protein|uniref:Uncharacterized protein n=1 Tax=Bacteroides fragilis (strain YCH46) TaxID=295405 RepID=Q64RL5_BACFR|nr:hypothetical protein M107_3174 [Bacteroides fragilis str. 3725 D9(v)]BAD49866.1 hypothetical protein BF3121 [Bacteroides fragilis YCH46]